MLSHPVLARTPRSPPSDRFGIYGRLRAVVRSQTMLEHTFPAPEVDTDFDDESI